MIYTQQKIAELQSQLSLQEERDSETDKGDYSSLKLSQVISNQEYDIRNLQSVNAGYKEEEAIMISMVNMMQRMEDISVACSDNGSTREPNIFAIEVEG